MFGNSAKPQETKKMGNTDPTKSGMSPGAGEG